MKAGILTFHSAHNYGAILQVYALQQILNDKNIEAEVIDYRLKEIDNEYKVLRFDLIKNLSKQKKYTEAVKIMLYNLLHLKSRISKYNKFNNFYKDYLKVTKRCKNHKDINNLNMDVYVCGSDQIWNSNITGDIISTYFCAFNSDKKTKRITYAASMGKSKLSREEEAKFRENLKSLTHISVRESQLKEYTEKFTDKPVTQVLDPTLLLNENKWKKISREVSINSKFLILYSLQVNENLLSAAETISKRYNLKIVIIGSKPLKQKDDYIYLDNIGPSEFLWLFENCDFVITNSFHGTCFSIINKKKFYTIPHSINGSRMISLLNILGLESRLIYKLNKSDIEKDINYEKVYNILNKHRYESLKFIEDAFFGEV